MPCGRSYRFGYSAEQAAETRGLKGKGKREKETEHGGIDRNAAAGENRNTGNNARLNPPGAHA